MFGSAKLVALIQVVMVLSVVLVCSGLLLTIFSCLKLRYIYFVFEFQRKLGCLRLFHDVSHCFTCFLSSQVVGQFKFFFTLLLFVVLFSCVTASLTYVLFVVSWYFGSFTLS